MKSSVPPMHQKPRFADDGRRGEIQPKTEATVKTEQLLEEIREANLTYLMLAQHMIRQDKVEALYRLGISEPVADILQALSPGQILKLAATNMLMCQFRFDDQMVWNLLTSHSKDRAHQSASGVHASILMAGQMAQAA